MARFFSEHLLKVGQIELHGKEAHHLIRVRRLGPGDQVEIFDSAGNAAEAKVTSICGDVAILDVLQIIDPTNESCPILVGVAFPKGERQKWLIEKCVEMGVTRLTPLHAARGVAIPSESAVERWRRQVIAACKQSGRSQSMEIQPPCSLPDFLGSVDQESIRLLADPRGEPWPALYPLPPANDVLPENQTPSSTAYPRAYACAIGPEGGWTDAEREQGIAAGWRLTRLGELTLRVETAAIAFVAAFHTSNFAISRRRPKD
jgi:16S rRNA (uracil1498-N3)-methyltransferase